MSAYHIETQVQSGMRSRGFDFSDGDKAHEAFHILLQQLTDAGVNEALDLVLFNEINEEIARAHVTP